MRDLKMNPSRRLFLKSLTAAAAIPLLSIYPQDQEPLVIASHIWPGYELMFLARHEGWLSGKQTQLLETVSATDSLKALATGKANAAALTLDEVLRGRASGIPLTCVLVFDVSIGADMVLSKAEINSLAELAGKRIGFERSAVGSLMLYKLLQAAKLPESAIIPVIVNYDQHLNAWQNNQVDVLISFDPVASQIVNRGAYKIFDSREIPDTIFDVLAVRSELITDYSEALHKLVSVHFQARDYFYHHPHDAAYKMAIRMGLSAHNVLNSFRGLNLPNMEANQKYLTERQSTLLTAAKNLSTQMMQRGIIQQPDDLQNLVSANFLPLES